VKIVIGSDHAGTQLKSYLVDIAQKLGHQVNDIGTFGSQSADYPDIAYAAACKVTTGLADTAVLICGTGIGMSLAANKVKGIRAAVCWNQQTAELARKHNDANILCLGARIMGKQACKKIMETFLSAVPSSQDRHGRRVAKIMNIEERICTGEDK